MTVLVLAAHPDDEVLGCGGTMARYVSEGHDVHIAILGEGMTSRFADARQNDRTDVDALHQTSHAAARILGVKHLSLFSLPDNRFDTVPLLEVVKIIERLIDQIQPEVVYTQ